MRVKSNCDVLFLAFDQRDVCHFVSQFFWVFFIGFSHTCQSFVQGSQRSLQATLWFCINFVGSGLSQLNKNTDFRETTIPACSGLCPLVNQYLMFSSARFTRGACSSPSHYNLLSNEIATDSVQKKYINEITFSKRHGASLVLSHLTSVSFSSRIKRSMLSAQALRGRTPLCFVFPKIETLGNRHCHFNHHLALAALSLHS